MRNYSQNTQELVSDLMNGIKVETSALSNLVYMTNSDKTIFNVFGRIKINALFGEVITAAGNQATTLQFKYIQSAPYAIAGAALTGLSASLANAVKGTRVVCLGGAVATAALVDVGPGISGYMYPMVVGTNSDSTIAVGLIYIDTAAFANLTGTTKFVICYVPLSDGAYVTAIA
jgi:hypothetical protein